MKGLGLLLCLTSLYALALAAVTLLNWSGPDRWWLGALNLYLPQIIWALPGVLLAIFIYRVDRLWTWLPLLCLAWVFGPMMDFRWAPKLPQAAPGSLAVRVMTWNIKYCRYDLAPLIAEIARWQPDVVLFQDAVGALDGPLAEYFRKWQVRSHGQFVIASKYPLSEVEVREFPSASGQDYLRCRLHLGPARVSLYNVHLKTPRKSLNAFRTARREPWHLPKAIEKFDHNINTRLIQASSIQGGVNREKDPVIVVGDLNAPDVSLVCATLRDAGLRDAFAERGRGYGYTYGHLMFKYRLPWLRVSWMRIDHVMVSSQFETRRCWTGTGSASDHRPVIADLVLRQPE